MLTNPTFLVGAERSGTTLLRLMLDHHPRISWKQEFNYAVELVGVNGDFPVLAEYYNWLETNRNFQSMGFDINTNYNYEELVDSFLSQQFDGDNKRFVGATVHQCFDRLLYIWPSARFIHITRDPRDVARSCVGMGWSGNVWNGVDRWVDAERLWTDLEKKLSREAYINIKYEELISDSEVNLSRICDFIGVEFKSSMLEYDSSTTYNAPDLNLVEQWRTKLTSKEVQLVESKVNSIMLARGYQLSGYRLIQINKFEEKLLNCQNKIYQTRHRISRLGLFLFLEDFISRKLGFDPWTKKVQLSINEIDKKYLK